jgi:hypothetical protein
MLLVLIAFQIDSYLHAGANAFPGTETTLESKVNAPVAVTAPASSLPQDVALVPIVIEVQSTFQAWLSYRLATRHWMPWYH